MISIYQKKIEYGMCDTFAQLKLPEILKMVEAGVASYFGLYHKDNPTIKKDYGALWLFTKTKVEIDRLPLWDEVVEIEAARVMLDSKLSVIVEIYIHPIEEQRGIHAWVECSSASISTRKLLRLTAIDFEIPFEKECQIQYEKWNEELSFLKSLKVSSSYIDYSRHVNNAEYLRMLLDCFKIEELEKISCKRFEIHYLKESKEDDLLEIRYKKIKKYRYFSIVRDVEVLEVRMEEE